MFHNDVVALFYILLLGSGGRSSFVWCWIHSSPHILASSASGLCFLCVECDAISSVRVVGGCWGSIALDAVLFLAAECCSGILRLSVLLSSNPG